MNILRIIFGNLWRAWFFVNAFVIFLFLYPFFLILLSSQKWWKHAFRLKKLWARFILFNAGIRYEIVNAPKLNPKMVYVFCPNHASILDIVISYVSIPQYFHFIGKAELKSVPLFRIFFKRMNIAVDRKSVTASHRAFIRAKQDIDKGISIALFPEATIPLSAPVLAPVKNGAFRLALDKAIPIVPITYVNTWKIMPDVPNRKYGGHPGKVFIYIHEPIETFNLKISDIEQLKEKVMSKIAEPLPVKEFRLK